MKEKLIMDALDVHAVTRYSLGHCRRLLRKIKTSNGKLKHQKVSVEEFSEYLGIDPEQIRSLFRKAG